jgi:hypothetical protein
MTEELAPYSLDLVQDALLKSWPRRPLLAFLRSIESPKTFSAGGITPKANGALWQNCS